MYHIFTVIFATDFDACIPADKIKELFASTLNRIPISVKCVFFMIVVLNLNLLYYLRRTQKKIRREQKKSDFQRRVLLVETHVR